MADLEKKLIVTALLSDLRDEEFMTQANLKVTAMAAYPLIVPGITPTPASVTTKLTNAQTIWNERADLIQQLKAKTTLFRAARKDINNDLVSLWVPKIQEAPGITVDLVQQLHYNVKNIDDGQGTPEVSIHNSIPLLAKVEYILPFEHVIYMCNNSDNTILLPYDAAHCDLYRTFDVNNLGDLSKMSYLGQIKHGKFTSHFHLGDEGKDVWYVAVYVGKDGKTGELSGSVKATVV